MPNNGYFDNKRDTDIEKAGGFWCHACLVSHPTKKQSPDPRYCQGCHDFLLKEVEIDTRRCDSDWKPKTAPKETAQVSEDVHTIMATLESKKFEVNLVHPRTASKASGKRGPKHRQLPEGLIMQLASEGMGSKAIATKLTVDCGIAVSYKTIQRVLSGERKQLVHGKTTD